MIELRLGWAWMVFRERWPSLVIVFAMLLVTLGVSLADPPLALGFYLVATRAGIGGPRRRRAPCACA